jgi:hypothetical protein
MRKVVSVIQLQQSERESIVVELVLTFGGIQDMKKFAVILIMNATVLALGAFGANLSGYIADAKCAAGRGAKAASADHAACAEKCIKGGSAAVLVTPDGKIYKLDDQAAATPHAGHSVTVTGDVSDDSIKVASIKMNNQ